jgi:alpha-N-arabinofuranosidase
MLGGAMMARLDRRSWRGAADEVRIDVLPKESIGPVTAALYGQFIEHLGAVVYDGIWVGERSAIPNIGGLRKGLVDDLKVLAPGFVRWPGGCFADSYDWRDGVGPAAKRPRRGNFWASELPATVGGAERYESNAFGTPELMRFCRLVGAEPYLAVNGRGRSPQDWAEWVDYCNAPAGMTTLADQRAADGSREPYDVRYWGIGNEPWGCGGNLTPEEYAEEYRRFSAWTPAYGAGAARDLKLIAAGPDGNDEGWTRRFFESLGSSQADAPYGFSVQQYFFANDDLTFGADGWYRSLAKPRGLATTIERQAGLLKVARVPTKLVLDEWGDWYRGDIPGVDPSHLFEGIPTMRDALVTAMVFDVLHAHADVVAMAAPAQLVNCIHALFLTKGAQCVRTPIYHAHALYRPHVGGAAVRTVVAAERVAYAAQGRDPGGWVDGVSASATVHDDRRVVVTLTNPRYDQPVTVTVVLRGGSVREGTVTTLTHRDPHAHNSVEAPDAVTIGATTPLALGSSATPDGCVVTVPAASTMRVEFTLGA